MGGVVERERTFCRVPKRLLPTATIAHAGPHLKILSSHVRGESFTLINLITIVYKNV